MQERTGGKSKQTWMTFEGKVIKYIKLILFHFEIIPNLQKQVASMQKYFSDEPLHSNLLAWCFITPKYVSECFLQTRTFSHVTIIQLPTPVKSIDTPLTHLGFPNCSGSILISKLYRSELCVYLALISFFLLSGKVLPFLTFHLLHIFDDYKPVIL